MDLALLVYGISLLHGIEGFFVGMIVISSIVAIVSGIVTANWKFSGSEYSWDLNKDGTVKEKVLAGRRFGEKAFKWSLVVFFISALLNVLIPNEKTAYTMVGAYAAQKVVENKGVQDTSDKVMTIINQKLDKYIDEGIAESKKESVKKVKEKVE